MKRPAAVPAVLAIMGFAALLVAFQQATKPDEDALVEDDVPYTTVGDRTLHMDVARPKKGDGPFPAVVFIHGGGWSAGDKREMREPAVGLATQGFVAATIEYRLVPDARFPAQLDDAKAAVRFVRSKAKEWKVDPDRIGVVGGSAGGHLALLLATTDDRDFPPVGAHLDLSSSVKVAVSLAGPTDLTPTFAPTTEPIVVALIGKPRSEAADAYRDASPIAHLGPGDAPVLMIHGDQDEIVPYDQSTKMLDACKKAGVEAELFTISGGGHGGGGKPDDERGAVLKGLQFLSAKLKAPAAK